MTVTADSPKLKMVKLYTYTSKVPISLKETITECSKFLDGAIGLFYSPQYCCFGKVNDPDKGIVTWYELQQGKESSWLQRTLDEIPVFEARIFTDEIELRWLNIPNRGGKAVLLSETAIDTPPFEPEPPVLENLYSHAQTYLLWGKGLDQDRAIPEGWSTLAESRIGRMAVPIGNIKDGQSVLLEYREYLGRASGMAGEQHGNISVVEERLIGLKLGVDNGNK